MINAHPHVSIWFHQVDCDHEFEYFLQNTDKNAFDMFMVCSDVIWIDLSDLCLNGQNANEAHLEKILLATYKVIDLVALVLMSIEKIV